MLMPRQRRRLSDPWRGGRTAQPRAGQGRQASSAGIAVSHDLFAKRRPLPRHGTCLMLLKYFSARISGRKDCVHHNAATKACSRSVPARRPPADLNAARIDRKVCARPLTSTPKTPANTGTLTSSGNCCSCRENAYIFMHRGCGDTRPGMRFS